ncbi:isoaspartyl peptidase/L-asparaginase, partial [Francisella tularensis subsp. holarctica]|uniref:isoaspartyl peptidase/L-asparaginase n=1 Tax=Francisella tularensis TaxID=263 RepID=UPI002381C948
KKGYTGTKGVVALDSKGKFCAVTSAGGAGCDYPGRVGDSPTVAGNFASECVGMACTGRGEQLVNLAGAAKCATRVNE